MNPLAETIYNAYPRKEAPDKAEKSILKALQWFRREEKLGLMEAHTRLLSATVAYAEWWKDKIAKKGPEEANYIPHTPTWFNSGNWKEPEKYALEPQVKLSYPDEEWCKDNWKIVLDQFGMEWGNVSYWEKTWEATWRNIPPPIKSELIAKWK